MIHNRNKSLVWDAHAGIFPSPKMNLDVLDDWHANEVDYLSINVGFDVMDSKATLETLAAYRHWILARPDRFLLTNSIHDIWRAKKTARLALSFDIEGMNALDNKPEMVEVFHTLGVRQMLFAYNLNNSAAGGCHDVDTGLTAFGKEVLSEMNRLGIIVDASHASYRTTMELMELSSTPVVFSHSNPNAVWQHERNISDEQVLACAANGGVIGLNGLGIFLGENDISSETLLRHLFYLFELVGPSHVGFGFDYSPDVTVDLSAILVARPDFWPTGQQYDTPAIAHAGPSSITALSEGMKVRGLTEFEIAGVLGGNFARVAAATWIPA